MEDSYTTPNIRGNHYLALAIVLLVLAIFAVALRFWSNHISPQHSFQPDDFFVIVALVLLVAHTSVVIWWISIGYGRPFNTIHPDKLALNYTASFCILIIFPILVTTPKLSVLFFYRRLFGKTSDRWFKVGLWITGFLVVGWGFASLCVSLFQCNPVHAAWDLTAFKTAKCANTYVYILAATSSAVFIDLCILLMPMPLLLKVKTTKKNKYLLVGLFICGYSVVIVTLGRLISVALSSPTAFQDFTYSTVSFYMWAQCEAPIAIISVSLPNILFLVRRIHQYGPRGLLKTGTGFTSHSKSRDMMTGTHDDSTILVSHETTVTRSDRDIEFQSLGSKKFENHTKELPW